MPDGIEPVSIDGIKQLGERFGLDVTEGDVDSLQDAVNDRLCAGLEGVCDVPIDVEPPTVDDRTWETPTDPYNAISTPCHVPPEPDNSGQLSGVSVGIKDIIAVAGVPMHCASEVMEGFMPTRDAAVAGRLLAAGGTITAKTNLDEFAGGGRGRSRRGLILNPRDETRIAGGSSGGSAAAVAAGLVDVALGTDTGGSIRKPAAFCSLVGLKPTYGLVPLTGVIENTYTLDHVGPLTERVRDAARVLEVIAGKDPRDPASMAAAGRDDYSVGGYQAAVEDRPDLEEVRIGVATEGLADGLDDIVLSRHARALDDLSDRGATIEEIEIPFLDQAAHVKNVISYVELAAYWRDGGAPTRRGDVCAPADQAAFARRARNGNQILNDFYRSRLFTGAHLLNTDGGRLYTRAHAARPVIRSALTERLGGLDAIVTPTVPYLAPTVEAVRDPGFEYDGLGGRYGYGRFTKIANVTGLPAVTVPATVGDGPAVGVQLIGRSFDERALLGLASRVEGVLQSTRS